MRGAAISLLIALLSSTALAEHFDIKLTATAPDGASKEAFADQTPPIGGLNPRPVLRAKTGDIITFQFMMTNVYAHESARNAGIHFYIVRERQLGQKAVPAPENL